MDAVFGAWLGLERLPVRDTTAGSATDCPECLITLDVLESVFGVTFDLDRAELEVDPRPSDATAKRAVARSRHLGLGGKRQFDSAAVAGTLMHGSRSLHDARSRGSGDCEA